MGLLHRLSANSITFLPPLLGQHPRLPLPLPLLLPLLLLNIWKILCNTLYAFLVKPSVTIVVAMVLVNRQSLIRSIVDKISFLFFYNEKKIRFNSYRYISQLFICYTLSWRCTSLLYVVQSLVKCRCVLTLSCNGWPFKTAVRWLPRMSRPYLDSHHDSEAIQSLSIVHC